MSSPYTINAVRAAASSAGDTSGNCDEAFNLIQRGAAKEALQRLEWAVENVQNAAARISEARAAILNDAQVQGGAE